MNNDPLASMRHSCEHVLTQAMLKLYPNLLMAMGPAIDDSFYFDFDANLPAGGKISEEDFPKIEAEMAQIIKQNLPITPEEISVEEARKLFPNNPYKQEWLNEIEKRGEKAIIYKTGNDFTDLCAGPHVESTRKIGPFKLLSVSGAYWHGNEKNKMLTRIYGTCFNTQEGLDKYLLQQEDAKKRDHRVLGKELDLFVFSDIVGKGLPLLTPKGTVIRKELEKFVIEEETKRGYQHVITPPLAKTELYKTSGHYPYYKDTMYPVMKVDEEELILRPMTCPHHFMLYKSKGRSYQELPIRFAELSPQFRYEKSGELSGLTRVRMFCLADAHIMCTKDQAKDEIKKVLELIDYANQVFGLIKGEDYRYRLSLGDRGDNKKYFKDDAAWDSAEDILRNVLQETNAPFYQAPGEAAFYGPKIDIQIKKVNGQEETAFTVQYDFVMPQRFEMKYINSAGEEEQPVVIHRSSIGAFERTMAFLIEKYAGAFPVWLSPIQVMIIPIADRHNDYATTISNKLLAPRSVSEEGSALNIRCSIDTRSERMQAKIRDAQIQKIPYMLIVGDRDMTANTVSVRTREEKDLGAMPIDQFIKLVSSKISTKSLNL